MAEGYIYLNRKLTDHWIWNSFPFSYGQAWVDLLFLANYEDKKTVCRGEPVECKRGTVNLSVSYLADRWHWSRDKARRFLALLERDQMCVVNCTTHRTTITIVNYDNFQCQPTTKRTTKDATSRQQIDTTNKRKEINNILTNIIYILNSRTGKNFNPESSAAKKHITARLNEGYTMQDFEKVIETKTNEWLNDPKMNKYLRPETLFGNKFESYLNEKGVSAHEVATTGRIYADVGIDCNQ